VALFALDFFGKSPASGLDWLFTNKGRLGLLLVALGIGFWPQLWGWVKKSWLDVRPPSRKRLKRETRTLVADLHKEIARQQHPSSTFADSEFFKLLSRQHRELQSADPKDVPSVVLRHSAETDAKRREKIDPLRERFGGRLTYLISEYRAYPVFGQPDGPSSGLWLDHLLESGNLVDLAKELEAMSHKL
jgi:hypothetical protein